MITIRTTKPELQNKIVRNPMIARKLLQRGNSIVDIKPARGDNNRTVFVFANTTKFQEDFTKVIKETQDAKYEAEVEARVAARLKEIAEAKENNTDE